MSRSADASVLRDVASCRDLHRSQMPDLSTASGAAKAVEDTVLLEVLLPAYAKLEDREEVCRDLGVFVQTGRGGPNGLSRRVCVRLTDPADPFFLFELELLEDDYGTFKQRLELLVDFSGFPKYLVSMLNSVVSGLMPYVVCFVVDSRDAARGTLRVLERTDFRTVEHISLALLRQGDAGQKRYLAERFQHFERAYTRATEEYQAEAAASAANIEALKSEVARLEGSRASLREQLNMEVAKSEKNQLASVSQLREEHAGQLSQLRSSFESELRHVTRKAEEVQKQLMDDMREKDKELQEARQRITTLESSIMTLQSQMRIAGDKCNAQAKELEGLRTSNDELQSFRTQATRSLSDTELNFVKMQERLRGHVQTLKSREEELKSLREQYQKQDNYIRIITSQNEQLTEQNKKNELSLSKAHHIIATQLKHIKEVKERERMMRNQIRSQDALMQEKMSAIARLRDELASSTERAQILQNKATELRDQLGKTDAAREKLAQELKQSQDALIHLQRSTSVNGRHWSVLAGPSSGHNLGVGLSSSCGSNSYDIYREFNRNASSTLRGAGGMPPYGSSDVAGMSTVHPNTVMNVVTDTTSGLAVGQQQQQGLPDSTSKSTANGVTPAAEVATGSNEAKPSSTTAGTCAANGRYTRQPLDATAINVALNHTTQAFSSKSFLNDGANKAGLMSNTASFIAKAPAVAAAAAPSSYF
ncbi:spindle assembly 6 [Trypanosoma grayi]|uniref:spindle assembly 6 n=1 Tax=Trypanosoma grayi TaxID=71804 RepID=UPI0004F437F4|nr:spindle assembly 6 [Trypanosoma grayi]KEG13662.1 spindle assembly 6 [Trypanosoma grayi]